MERKIICWSKSYEVLERSASGGVMYELAKQFIAKNGIVIGVNSEGEFGYATTLEQVQDFQGSKYWRPTGLYDLIDSLRKETRDILFVGTPCQVRYVKNAWSDRTNVLYVSLECHGFYGKKGLTRNGKHKINGWSKSWYHLPKNYLNCRNIEYFCKNCNLGNRPLSDLIISDAWDCPKHQINEYGTSRVIVKTEKGYDALKNCDNLHTEYEGTYQLAPERIALLDVHDYNNFGNQLLAVNFINKMHELNPDIEFVFLEERADNAHEVIDKQVDAKVIYRTINLTREPMTTILKDGIGLETIADCDSIVVLGGDCFSENSWHWKWIRYFLFFYLVQKKKMNKLFFVSNTIGNFPLYIRAFGKNILKNFNHIFIRDKWSEDQLRDLGVKSNVSYMPDLAYVKMNTCWNTKNESYVVFSPSGLWYKYSDTRQNYISESRIIVDVLKAYTKKKVIVMPHSSDDSEMRLAVEIALSTGSELSLPFDATQARQILQNSRFNICYRMHSALQSLQANVPCAVVGYSQKYENIIPKNMLTTHNAFDIGVTVVSNYNKPVHMQVAAKRELINYQMKRLLSMIKDETTY